MTATQKIEKLTNAWYGFAFVMGILTFLQNGIGVFSFLGAAASTCFSFLLTWFLGRRLLKRSSLWRTILLVVSFCGMLFGALGSAKLAWAFVSTFSLQMLLASVCAIALTSMYFRSFRVLTDRSVKSYFA
jgi:hypothetical protein